MSPRVVMLEERYKKVKKDWMGRVTQTCPHVAYKTHVR